MSSADLMVPRRPATGGAAGGGGENGKLAGWQRCLSGLVGVLLTLLGVWRLFVAESWFELALGGLVIAFPHVACGALRPRRAARVLLFELPVTFLFCVFAASILAMSLVQMLSAPLPWRSVLLYALYLFSWILSLRVCYWLLLGAALRVCRRATLARTAAGLALLVVGMPNLFVGLQTHRVAVEQRPDLAFAEGRAQHVRIATESARTLAATLVESAPRSVHGPRTVVVVCHGLGANRAVFFEYARVAHRLGCDALAFDFRGHGGSDGLSTTLGILEPRDVVAAVRFLRGLPQYGEDATVVLVGVSMGGAAVLQAAARCCPKVRGFGQQEALPAVDGVFAESSYVNLSTMLDERMAGLGWLAPLASGLIHCAVWLQYGSSIEAASPLGALRNLDASVPVALIHAGQDRLIPVQQGRTLASSRPGLELHVVPFAGHGCCLFADRKVVQERLRELIEAARGRRRG